MEELQKAFPEYPYAMLTGNVWNLTDAMAPMNILSDNITIVARC